jgi:hypothetical protein
MDKRLAVLDSILFLILVLLVGLETWWQWKDRQAKGAG